MRTRPKKLYLSKIIGRVRIGRTDRYYLCGRFQPILFKAYEKVSVSCLTSCYCDKYAVGTINPEEPLVHVASEHNQHFLCGLIVNHQKVKSYVPGVENYVIENKQTFWDGFVSGITFGIYTPTTTKFYVPKSNANVVVKKKKPMSKTYKGYLKD